MVNAGYALFPEEKQPPKATPPPQRPHTDITRSALPVLKQSEQNIQQKHEVRNTFALFYTMDQAILFLVSRLNSLCRFGKRLNGSFRAPMYPADLLAGNARMM